MNGEKKEIFPGSTFGERISNELADVFFKADYRKEFLVMSAYSVILFGVTLYAFLKNKLPINNIEVFGVFIVLGAYWFFSDLSKRKKFLSSHIQFIVDSVFYVSLMYLIVSMTGGQDSPIRYPLYFLIAISSPLYGSLIEVIVLLLVVAFIQVYVHLAKFGVNFDLLFTLLEGLTFIAAAIFVKISLTTIQKKVEEQKLLNLELDSKLEETTVTLSRIRLKNEEVDRLNRENLDLKKRLG